MQKAELIAFLNHFDLQCNSIALSVRECADSLAFDEGTDFIFLSIDIISKLVRVRRWASVFVRLSADSHAIIPGTQPLQRKIFEENFVVRKPSSIFYIKMFLTTWFVAGFYDRFSAP